MNLLLPFVLGFSTSFLGMFFPGMLNMATVKISIERGKLNALKFAIGVSIIVLIQAYTAIYFTKLLKENPDFIQSIQKIALIIFILLSIYFYREHKNEKKRISVFQQQCKNTFGIGLLFSALNMFAIPFYYGITTIINNFVWFKLSQNNIILFTIGSAIGTFMILYSYSNFADLLKSKSHTKTNPLNFILSILTGVLALISFIRLI